MPGVPERNHPVAGAAGPENEHAGEVPRLGWLTRRSGDGGADFVGRLDIGSGLADISLVVLGQAKCVKLDNLVTAERIARVVARLRRGWIGVYVTTGAYSVPAQTEIVEDQYPIVLINGLELAREIRSMARDDHGGDLGACLGHILTQREIVITSRRPEEVLRNSPSVVIVLASLAWAEIVGCVRERRGSAGTVHCERYTGEIPQPQQPAADNAKRTAPDRFAWPGVIHLPGGWGWRGGATSPPLRGQLSSTCGGELVD
ncbi:restriction endonuclease [Streptomyces albidoflavus]